MIIKASVILQHGRISTDPTDFMDSRGIAVGNEYMLNLDGTTRLWKITKIVRDYATAEPSVDD